jgi:hypothetical protein
MSASPSAPGPARRRSVSAATTTRTFTGPASFCPTLPARLWMHESKLRLACKCNYSMKNDVLHDIKFLDLRCIFLRDVHTDYYS